MSKLQIDANELTNMDVEFVSLVKRGANRLPFRITKDGEDDMIDLSTVGRRFVKKADVAPAILAVVVAKSADLDAIKDALKDTELSFENPTEQEDVTIFKQDGVEDKDTVVLKMTDDVGLLVTNLKKSFSSFSDSTSFSEVMSTEGFFPALGMATEMLRYTVGNIMYKTDDAGKAKTAIEKAIGDFGKYITKIADSIPQQAFKAEEALDGLSKEMDKKKKTPGATDEDEDPAKAKKADDPDPAAATVQKADGEGEDADPKPEDAEKTDTGAVGSLGDQPIRVSPQVDGNIEGDPAHGNETPGATGGKQPHPGTTDGNIEGNSATQQLKDEILAAVKDAMSDMSRSFGEQLTQTNEALSALMRDVGQLSDRTTKAEAALNGTVGGAPQDDNIVRRGVKKSAGGAPPLLDTGYDATGLH